MGTRVVTQISTRCVHNLPHPFAVFSNHCDYTDVACNTTDDRFSRTLCGLMCFKRPSSRETQLLLGSRTDSRDQPCYNYRAVGLPLSHVFAEIQHFLMLLVKPTVVLLDSKFNAYYGQPTITNLLKKSTLLIHTLTF